MKFLLPIHNKFWTKHTKKQHHWWPKPSLIRPHKHHRTQFQRVLKPLSCVKFNENTSNFHVELTLFWAISASMPSIPATMSMTTINRHTKAPPIFPILGNMELWKQQIEEEEKCLLWCGFLWFVKVKKSGDFLRWERIWSEAYDLGYVVEISCYEEIFFSYF